MVKDLNPSIKIHLKIHICRVTEKRCKDTSAAEKRAPKHVANINSSLQYYLILLDCKFSGKPRKKTGRKKETKIFCQNCPFEIYLTASEDHDALEVLRMNLDHNHEKSKVLY